MILFHATLPQCATAGMMWISRMAFYVIYKYIQQKIGENIHVFSNIKSWHNLVQLGTHQSKQTTNGNLSNLDLFFPILR